MKFAREPIYFVSSNKHKIGEIRAIAHEFGIKIIPRSMELKEEGNKLEQIAKFKADYAWSKIRKPLFVEDTGVYFNAYDNFPGHTAKRTFYSLGLKGLMRLVKSVKNRRAVFKTVICFKPSKNKSKIFSGELHGTLLTKFSGLKKDVLPYEKMFVPNGFSKALALIDRKDKNEFSHRALASRKFFRWMKKQ